MEKNLIFFLCLLYTINSLCFKDKDSVSFSKDCKSRTITSQDLELLGEEDGKTSDYTCCLFKASGGIVKYCYPVYTSTIDTINDGLEEGNSIDCSGNGGDSESYACFKNNPDFIKLTLLLILFSFY